MFAFEGLLIPLADWEIQNQSRKIMERAHMKPDGGQNTLHQGEIKWRSDIYPYIFL